MTTETITRQQISVLIQTKLDHIEALKREIVDLRRQWHLTSDEKQWFEEKTETHEVKEGRKRVKKDFLIGRIHWNEDFTDEDTGDVITIARSSVVRVDGEWQI